MKHDDILRKATGKNLLFKYIPPVPSHRPHFLQTELFRFTQPNELNDPFEARPRVLMNEHSKEDYEEMQSRAIADGFPNISKEEIEIVYLGPAVDYRLDEKIAPGLWPARLRELRNEPFHSIEELDHFRANKASNDFIEKASRNVGIFCLTKEPHSLLMWAHYAADHKGMLLAFDQDHTFFKRGTGLHAVEYDEERLSITSNSGMTHFCGVRFENSIPLLLRAFLRKHPVWSNEAEVRMILPLVECDNRPSDNPFVYLFRIPAEALCAVVFGSRISEKDAKFIRLLSLKDHRWKHIKLFNAIFHKRDMALDYIRDN